jgi:putative Holliday junction resolvase
MKLMGIDYGRRRIGLAVTDETCTCVRGTGCITVTASSDTIVRIAGNIAQEKPDKLIFGLPLDPDGNETAMSKEVMEFAHKIEEHTNLPIAFYNEEFTSIEAQKLVRLRPGKKRRRDKGLIDRLAACLILEHYIMEMEHS